MDRLTKITSEEWQQISFALEEHHAVFYQIWQMGKPIFTDNIETAAVQFDEKGNYLNFLFNPDFYKSLTFNDKLFVICHEALHVILNHGIRIADIKKNNRMSVNAALDVVVNHSLVKNFGFKREEITNQEKYCWVDTVFAGRDPLPSNDENFEYYFNLFEKFYGDGGMLDMQLVDEHEEWGKNSNEIIKKLNNTLGNEEKETIKNILSQHCEKSTERGTGTGGWIFIKNLKANKKKKWETVIARWTKKYYISADKDLEQWAKLNRRLLLLPKDSFLPSEQEIESKTKNKNKIDVWFFLDTSGSCYSLKERFFAAAESLSPKKFKVRLFCFDTQVAETSLASRKIYGGGGTSFDIIERHIQIELRKDQKKYPEAVFILTDGYGNHVNPQKAENWHWFLVSSSSKNYIPKQSKVYKLEEFE